MKHQSTGLPILLLGLVGALNAPITAQEPTEPSAGEYLTVEEFDEAMSEFDAMLAQLGTANPGNTRFLFSGYATAGYVDPASGPSSFGAAFSPVMLWRIDDDFLFEAELEAVSDAAHGADAIGLEYAQLSWTANDWITVGAGKFLSPMTLFNERFHPSWINPLPNAPMFAGHDGLVPATMVGAQVRGNLPAGDTRLLYVLFVSNGPELNNGEHEPEEAGFLHFEDGAAGFHSKAVGGRLGWKPMHWLEFGVAGMSANVDADGTSAPDAGVKIYGANVAAAYDAKEAGTVRAIAEWFHSEVDDLTYLPGTPEAVTFDNARDGAYAMLAWRPPGTGVLSRFEPVVRYDWIDQPADAPEGEDLKRWTVGLDYWLSSHTVFKIAVDRNDFGGETSSDLIIQAAIGF